MSQGPADNIRYEVLTQKDKSNDDVLIPIPPILLKKIGWKEGDEIDFSIDGNGNYQLKRVPK